MSELKQYCEDMYGEPMEVEFGHFYLKSEADKVIAHQKYKRCMAMARRCSDAYNRECGLNPEEMTDKEFYKQQIEFWPRWHYKWLELAEKFKEAN